MFDQLEHSDVLFFYFSCILFRLSTSNYHTRFKLYNSVQKYDYSFTLLYQFSTSSNLGSKLKLTLSIKTSSKQALNMKVQFYKIHFYTLPNASLCFTRLSYKREAENRLQTNQSQLICGERVFHFRTYRTRDVRFAIFCTVGTKKSDIMAALL